MNQSFSTSAVKMQLHNFFDGDLYNLKVIDLRHELENDDSTDATGDTFDIPNDLEDEVDKPMQSIFGYKSEKELSREIVSYVISYFCFITLPIMLKFLILSRITLKKVYNYELSKV